jgi:hypothetical protein
VVDAVDFQFGLSPSAAALGSALPPERTTSGAWLGTVELSASSEGTIRGKNQNNHVHTLSRFPLCEIEGVDGEG